MGQAAITAWQFPRRTHNVYAGRHAPRQLRCRRAREHGPDELRGGSDATGIFRSVDADFETSRRFRQVDELIKEF